MEKIIWLKHIVVAGELCERCEKAETYRFSIETFMQEQVFTKTFGQGLYMRPLLIVRRYFELYTHTAFTNCIFGGNGNHYLTSEFINFDNGSR